MCKDCEWIHAPMVFFKIDYRQAICRNPDNTRTSVDPVTGKETVVHPKCHTVRLLDRAGTCWEES